jgi:hypothetical protein
MLSRRLQDISEYLLYKSTFIKGCSCPGDVFVMKQIIETRRECHLEPYIDFIDFAKAFV